MSGVSRVDDSLWKGMFVCLIGMLIVVAIVIVILARESPPRAPETQALFDTEHPGVPLNSPAPPE